MRVWEMQKKEKEKEKKKKENQKKDDDDKDNHDDEDEGVQEAFHVGCARGWCQADIDPSFRRHEQLRPGLPETATTASGQKHRAQAIESVKRTRIS